VNRALSNRSGISLASVLAALVLIQCVVAGLLHMAILERQVVAAGESSVRSRFAAETALARAAAAWPAAADTMRPAGSPLQLLDTHGHGYRLQASLHRLGSPLYLLRASAAEARGHGSATVAMLLVPPILPPSFVPGPFLREAPAGPGTPGDSVILRVATAQHRLHGRTGVVVLRHGEVVTGSLDGFIFAAGDLKLGPSARLRGILVAAGSVSAAPGAALSGALIARGLDAAAPLLIPDPAAAEQAVDQAWLRRPDRASGRYRIPMFGG
jgi:hypothetical protein